ncbi:toprim domain-containing protein, partial [Candidatus Uhrbacteria bacterium]|nr:toprim domain-containing protein [Candidatus Uhrbacteria bacterium]
AVKFYENVLKDAAGAKHARDYVDGRAISDDLRVRFGIGYAPDEWNALCHILAKNGFSDGEIVEAGLGLRKKSGSGIIDRFRNRVMIPLRDHHGNTVGFTGRALSKDAKAGPKYMNSPETMIYHKGRLVYGLDVAKRGIKDASAVIVTEGNLDVVASHKVGVENIVASSGTALTEDQLTLLKRYTETIIFAFDSDAAGFKAAKKGMAIARGLGLDVRAAVLPNDVKDPDELVQKDPEVWVKIANNSVPIMEFLIKTVIRGKDLSNIDDKRLIAKELLPAISEMQGVVEREHWLQKVSDLLSVDQKVLRDSINKKVKITTKKKDPVVKKEKKAELERESIEDQVFQLLFGYLVQTDDRDLREKLKAHLPSSKLWITLYKLMEEGYDSGVTSAQKSNFSRLRTTVDGHQMREELLPLLDKTSILAEQTFRELPRVKVLKQLENLFNTLERGVDKRHRANVARELRQAEAAGDQAAVSRLLDQLSE